MAQITVQVQSALKSGLWFDITIDDTSNGQALINALAVQDSGDVGIVTLALGGVTLDPTASLASQGVADGDRITASNTISRLPTKEDRQVSKLNVSSALWTRRTGEPVTFEVNQLPTRYVGNVAVPNDHPGGLLPGRPRTARGGFSAFTGSGTEENPFLIYDGSALELLKTERSAHFKLANDVNAPEGSWRIEDHFYGHFDGQGFTIDMDGLILDGPDPRFFGNRCFGTVERLGVLNPYVSAQEAGTANYKAVFFTAFGEGGIIRDCYIEGGTIETAGDRSGGFIGWMNTGSIQRCWAAINRIGGTGRTGPLAGWASSTIFSNNAIQDSFFDSDVWGSAFNGDGITGRNRTTSQMRTQATFTNWDFTNSWTIDEGQDYPRLRSASS